MTSSGRFGYSSHFIASCLTVVVACMIVMWCPMAFSASNDFIVVDVLFGEPIPLEAMLDDLATVKIIYLGEIHTITRHHRIQTELLRRLASKGVKLAFGMEMFSEEQQTALDRWQNGRAGFRELVKDLGEEKWTNLKDYQSLITTARKLGVPIVALNAPDDLVRKVARDGLNGLTESERALVPPGVTEINPQYARLLRMRLKVHKAFKHRALDNIIIAQCVRDATMARALVRFLDSAEGGSRTMLVIAGSGHMNYGFGIPERVEALRSLPHRIAILSESGELVLSEFEKKHSVPVEIRHEELRFIRAPIADYLLLKALKKKDAVPHNNGIPGRTAARRPSN
ncbi:MAG: ChaN family lipoprotein [Desulfomonile sp.]|nr:ChaN family lipoprotein [Desulfomonile sp.]